MQELPLSQRRGFEFSEFGHNQLAILMVKAPIEQTISTTAELLDGKLEIDVLEKEYKLRDNLKDYDETRGWDLILHQYSGHDWTIVFNFDVCADRTVAKISQLLDSYCIYLQYQDTSSWSGYNTARISPNRGRLRLVPRYAGR